MRKIVSFIMIFALVFGLMGCDNKLPDGIENKEFYKDLDSLLAIMVKSFQTKTYKEEVDKILEKMNREVYTSKLNNYEMSILNTINDTIPQIKHDLDNGDHTLKYGTHKKIEWIFDIFKDR